jgi:hypothetical protein
VSAATSPQAASTAPAGATTWVPLFNVQFYHNYYNASNNACHDFTVTPTPDCAQLMASLGMLFKDLGAGFSVLIDQARIPAMIAYLGLHYAAAQTGAGYWTKLSFVLVTNNPNFLDITLLPITTNPMAQGIYTSNLETRVTSGLMLLGGTSGAAAALYPITGAGLSVATPQGATATLRDISGAAVPVATTPSGTVTRFALGSLPFGQYSVTFADESGTAVPATKGAPTTWLYVPVSPPSFCLLDLLLTQPTPSDGDPAAFPVAPMTPPQSGAPAPDPSLTPVTLVLPFRSRKTYWNYYICSQDRKAKFAPGLQITGTGTTFTKSVEQLPNGDPALLFAARTPLPLQQVSKYRFQLSGQRNGTNGSRDEISIDWLPAAAATPVWPLPSGDQLAGSSEIYVYV